MTTFLKWNIYFRILLNPNVYLMTGLKLLFEMKIRLIDFFKNSELINNLMTRSVQFMYPSVSRPGILYGLPKVHKQNVPLRPILSAIGTCGYKLSIFLLPFIEPNTTNEFTVKDSFSFVEELKGLQNCCDYFMASFVLIIKSLLRMYP